MKLEDALNWSNKHPDKSDGCTYAPDFNFGECCRMHDLLVRLWNREHKEQITRKDADLLTRECIESKGHPILAFIYYYAMRAQAKVGFGGIAGIIFLIIFIFIIIFG